MKTINLILLILLCLAVSYGCKNNSAKTNKGVEHTECTNFKSFSNHSFFKLDFNYTTSQNTFYLSSNNFIEIEEDVYFRSTDSIFVIISKMDDELKEFLMYFKSDFHIKKAAYIYTELVKKSSNHIGSEIFSELEFENTKTPFRLTYFSVKDFIRLSFTEKEE